MTSVGLNEGLERRSRRHRRAWNGVPTGYGRVRCKMPPPVILGKLGRLGKLGKLGKLIYVLRLPYWQFNAE